MTDLSSCAAVAHRPAAPYLSLNSSVDPPVELHATTTCFITLKASVPPRRLVRPVNGQTSSIGNTCSRNAGSHGCTPHVWILAPKH